MKTLLKIIIVISFIALIPVAILKFLKYLEKEGIKLDELDFDFDNKDVKTKASDYVVNDKYNDTDKDNKNELKVNEEKAKFTKAVKMRDKFKEKKGIVISKRQKDILSSLKLKKKLSMKDLQSEFKSVTSRTLRRDLSKLVELKLIKKEGNTKDSIYKMK